MSRLVPYGHQVPAPVDENAAALDLLVDRRKEMAHAAEGAFNVIDRPLDAFLWWPWAAMHLMCGSIPPEEFWIIAGLSGSGKTTLLMSLADVWVSQMVPVVYVGLEMPPKVLLVQLACRRLAARGVRIHPGDVIKGRLMPGHPDLLPDAPMLREVLREEIAFIKRELFELIRFVPVQWLTAGNVARICEQAAAWGVRAIIVDHLDHLDADEGSQSEYDQHAAVLKRLHAATKKYGITVLGAAQMNTDALRRPGGSLRAYQRPTTDMITFGMLKRRISDIQLICYRPLPLPPDNPDNAEAYRDAMRMLRDDSQRLDRYLIPNTMGIVLDKDRPYGHDGRSTLLGVQNSRITDHDPMNADVALTRLLSLAKPKPFGKARKEAQDRAAATGTENKVLPIRPPKPIQADWMDDD